MCFHGDVGQDELQREGTVPGAAVSGEEEGHEPEHRREALGETETSRQAEGEVQHHVERAAGKLQRREVRLTVSITEQASSSSVALLLRLSEH